jgi:hypothetical protein
MLLTLALIVFRPLKVFAYKTAVIFCFVLHPSDAKGLPTARLGKMKSPRGFSGTKSIYYLNW